MWQSIIALLSQVLSFATKIAPDDKFKDQKQKIDMPRLEADAYIKIYNKEFIRLCNHTEIDIRTDVDFVTRHSMPTEQEEELIKLLTDRITQYRQHHPIIFRKWLKAQGMK